MAVHLNPSAHATLVLRLLLWGEGARNGGRPSRSLFPHRRRAPSHTRLSFRAKTSARKGVLRGGLGGAATERERRSRFVQSAREPHDAGEEQHRRLQEQRPMEGEGDSISPVGGEEGHRLPGIPPRRAASSIGRQQSDLAAAQPRRMEILMKLGPSLQKAGASSRRY
ncbi:uncharacterized protein LOC119432372 [Dermacentor silvarum]|uniref:uncharacterized protein LOC119432372 n=1 Tax=Dermacentor silvarum TaxID=543639 RepID=UPI002101B12B|nr:uncharacterized protein LOC119432372 [Dermacentor silvarum]